MIKASAPGKLFLAGEWAILDLGNPGIVAAVSKRVYSQVEPAAGKYISVTIDDFRIRDLRFTWTGEEMKLFHLYHVDESKIRFLKVAIETALRFLQEKGIGFRQFKIRTWGEESQILVDGVERKVGFGSSAASTVAIIQSVLAFHGLQATREELYKLATIAHYFAQGKIGSGFDIAASVYGGIFAYKRFDGDWLTAMVQQKKRLDDIVGMEWPRFEVEQLPIPESLRLDVAWTRSPASTTEMVRKVNDWVRFNRSQGRECYGKIAHLVRDLLLAWKERDRETILAKIRENEPLLRELGERAGVAIETPDLRRLSEIANSCGGAGKLSGAGGGDCGIGISFDKATSDRIRREWAEAGLHVIDAAIDRDGIRTEK